jgi:putative ABC transport system permease protein
MGGWTLGQDLRQAIRVMRAQPGFAAAAIIMLALGIGSTTAIFSVVKAVLINPLPYPNADALVRIAHNIGGIDQDYFNDAIFLTYAEHAQAFESVGAWTPESTGVTITGQGDPEEVRALNASHGLFTTLGVQPEIGRWFSVEEGAPGGPDTVMLGAGYWRRRFGGDPTVVGRSIVINGRPHQIIGVMPARFTFGGDSDVMLPLRINPARPVPFFYLNGVARLKSGVTLAGATADIPRVLEIYFDTYKANTKRAVRWVPIPAPLKEVVVGDVGPTLWVLMGTIVLVLVMACANVANLLLVRAESRRQEFAIRAALGARWTRVARALLVESMMLAGIGGALGLTIAYAGLRIMVAVEPANVPRLSEISIDPAVVMFAIAVTLLCGMCFSLIPIAKYFGPRFVGAIGVGTRGISLTRERQRSQYALVAVQVALALVLLVGSGLMIRSFQALRNVEPGFAQPQTLQAFTITIPPSVIADLEGVLRLQRDVLDKVAALPGVTSVAFTTRMPMDPDDRWSAALAHEDKPHDGQAAPPNRQVKVISPGSFHTFGTPIVAGRDYTWTDLEQLREVAIVSESLAREVWGSPQAALGKRIRQFYGSQQAPWREIIGVAGDVYDDGVYLRPPATVYWPGRLNEKVFAGYQPRRVSMVVRTDRAGTESLLGELQQVVWSINPGLPLARPTTLDVLYDRSMSRTSFTLAMLAIAGGMALLLGICGIYGVIAYAVAQRRREIGIRMALGAQAHQIRAMFLRRGLLVATVGLLLGLGAAVASTRLMQAILFGVEPLDPITFATMPVVLTAAAILATYLPARRAMLVDPVETMRAE